MTDKTYGPAKLTIEQMHSNRQDADAAGHSHYFTGKPCNHGHISPKRIINNRCLKCENIAYKARYIPKPRRKKTKAEIAERQKVYRLANQEKIKIQRQQHYQENKESLYRKHLEWRNANNDKINKKDRERYRRNPEKFCAKFRIYYQENREAILEKKKDYRRKNKDKISLQNRAYYQKLKAEK